MSRTDDIRAELRASAPSAPDHLRTRVETITAREQVRRRPAFTMRRTSLVLVGGLLLCAMLGAGLIQGLGDGSDRTAGKDLDLQGGLEVTLRSVHRERAKTTEDNVFGAYGQTSTGASPAENAPALGAIAGGALQDRVAAGNAPAAKAAAGAPLDASQLPPSSLRLQSYDVQLGVRVKNPAALSRATVEAMRWTRAYGGFVAKVAYDTPGRRKGESELILRVPVGRVQDALQKLSSLGVLTSQHVSIQDLQGTVNTQTKRIITLNRRIGAILATLATPQTVEQTAQLQAELAARRSELAAMQVAKAATVKQGRLARIYLELRTQAKQQVVVPPKLDKPGTIERKLDSAGHILAQELAFVLAALVVSAPFLLLGAAALVAARAQRRRTDRRLLDATPS